MSSIEEADGRENREVVKLSTQIVPQERSVSEWHLPQSLALGGSRIILRGEGQELLKEGSN